MLVPGAQVYKRGNVTVSYLDGYEFVICMSHCLFFPLGPISFIEDQYTFTLDVTEFVGTWNIPYIFLSPNNPPYLSIKEFLASPERFYNLSSFVPNALFP